MYVDESGSISEDDYFVLGGVAVRDSQIRPLTRLIEGVMGRHLDQHLRGIELHAQHVRGGKGPWRSIPPSAKHGLLDDVGRVLGRFSADRGCALFSVAKAPGAVPRADPLERSFEELLLRFKQMLIRVSPTEMGVVIADKARYEALLQPIVQRWQWTSGTRFGRLERLAEVPLFIDSKASRLTQAADYVAHAVYRHYAAQDSSLFDVLVNGFDSDERVMHGLVHLVRNYRRCACPACMSRVAMMHPRS